MASRRVFVTARPVVAACSRGFSTTGSQLSSSYPYPLVRIPQPAQTPPESTTGSSSVGLAFGDASTAAETQSSRIIGWLKGKDDPITPQRFVENPGFWPLVLEVLEKHAHKDPELTSQAAFQKNGWLNIADGRNPPPLGRTADADDILGCVLVENKVIQPGSFQPNWVHRPVTRDGLFQLPKYLHAKLVDTLKQQT